MSPDIRERYKRQLMTPGFTEKHQQALLDANVVLAGIGGLGGAIAYGLAAAGVGAITLVHSGPLTESNLNRQTLMNDDAVGQSRVEVAKKRLEQFSRFVRITAHDIAITKESFPALLTSVDLVIDARHNFPERRVINRAAMAANVPLIYTAMNDLDGMVACFEGSTTGCLDCLYPEDPKDWDPFGFPVFGAVAHTVGGIAVMEAVKRLSGFGAPSKRLTTISMGDYQARSFKLRPVADCPTCQVGALAMLA